jgi:hypothetical protein
MHLFPTLHPSSAPRICPVDRRPSSHALVFPVVDLHDGLTTTQKIGLVTLVVDGKMSAINARLDKSQTSRVSGKSQLERGRECRTGLVTVECECSESSAHLSLWYIVAILWLDGALGVQLGLER